jgi:hypothetical protein
MAVADHIEEGYENVKARIERSTVFTKPLHDVRVLLWDHDGGPGKYNDDENCEKERNDQTPGHISLP